MESDFDILSGDLPQSEELIPLSRNPNYIFKEINKKNKLFLSKELVNLENSFIPYKENNLFNNFMILESPIINNIRDRFISREINRWDRETSRRREPRVIQPIPESIQQSTPLELNKHFRSATGLSATTSVVVYDRYDSIVRGEQLLPNGTHYARIDFLPGGRMSLIPERRTDSLAKCIQGFMELLEAMEQGRFENVTVLMGSTNIHMALFTQRLGFEIVDRCRKSNGEIDKSLDSFTVVGRIADIRKRVVELRQSHMSRLVQRNKRLTSVAS